MGLCVRGALSCQFSDRGQSELHGFWVTLRLDNTSVGPFRATPVFLQCIIGYW